MPLIPWSIFSFLPLVLVHNQRLPMPAAAIGQFMLFRRRAYEQVGGHAAVRRHVAEDLALGRRIKADKLCLRLMDGGQRVRVRMYRNSREAYEGFGKNLFAAFDYHIFTFGFVWVWLGSVFVEPLIVLALGLCGVPIHPLPLALAAIAIAASILLSGMMCWRFRFPIYLLALYPVSILLAVIVAFRSMFLTLSGRTIWKGRTLRMAGKT